MLYLIDLESYKERYTYWWKDYIPSEFFKYNLEFEIIEGGQLTKTVDVGTVLDAAGTNYYKSIQLQKICELFKANRIKDNDHFLIADIWFPGIEMIRYMANLYHKKVYIWGIWHAGSITMGDFAQIMNPWSKYFEYGFINMCDGVFVGSEYSKNSILERLTVDFKMTEEEYKSLSKKIHAYGMPLDYNYLQKFNNVEKENIIIFPHRPDEEKGINEFLNLIEYLFMKWDKVFDYTFLFTTSKLKYKSQSEIINNRLSFLQSNTNLNNNIIIKENLDKEEYYSLLGKSKFMISTSLEENFGYVAVEALALGCHVLVPNNFSYPELVEGDKNCLYDTLEELADKIKHFNKNEIINRNIFLNYAEPYNRVVHKWIGIMMGVIT